MSIPGKPTLIVNNLGGLGTIRSHWPCQGDLPFNSLLFFFLNSCDVILASGKKIFLFRKFSCTLVARGYCLVLRFERHWSPILSQSKPQIALPTLKYVLLPVQLPRWSAWFARRTFNCRVAGFFLAMKLSMTYDSRKRVVFEIPGARCYLACKYVGSRAFN